MKTALAIAVPLGAFLTIVAWRLSDLLSPDAIGMAIGLLLGVFAGVPSVALVLLPARRRDEEDEWQPTVIDYPPPPVVYAHQVTPYTHAFRWATGMPPLPDLNEEIDTLRAALSYLESEAQR